MHSLFFVHSTAKNSTTESVKDIQPSNLWMWISCENVPSNVLIDGAPPSSSLSINPNKKNVKLKHSKSLSLSPLQLPPAVVAVRSRRHTTLTPTLVHQQIAAGLQPQSPASPWYSRVGHSLRKNVFRRPSSVCKDNVNIEFSRAVFHKNRSDCR
jgi:hypothetical protein